MLDCVPGVAHGKALERTPKADAAGTQPASAGPRTPPRTGHCSSCSGHWSAAVDREAGARVRGQPGGVPEQHGAFSCAAVRRPWCHGDSRRPKVLSAVLAEAVAPAAILATCPPAAASFFLRASARTFGLARGSTNARASAAQWRRSFQRRPEGLRQCSRPACRPPRPDLRAGPRRPWPARPWRCWPARKARPRLPARSALDRLAARRSWSCCPRPARPAPPSACACSANSTTARAGAAGKSRRRRGSSARRE